MCLGIVCVGSLNEAKQLQKVGTSMFQYVKTRKAEIPRCHENFVFLLLLSIFCVSSAVIIYMQAGNLLGVEIKTFCFMVDKFKEEKQFYVSDFAMLG